MSNLAEGLVVPIPTLPDELMRMRSVTSATFSVDVENTMSEGGVQYPEATGFTAYIDALIPSPPSDRLEQKSTRPNSEEAAAKLVPLDDTNESRAWSVPELVLPMRIPSPAVDETMSNFLLGLLIPIPTLPLEVMRIRSVGLAKAPLV